MPIIIKQGYGTSIKYKLQNIIIIKDGDEKHTSFHHLVIL